MQGGTLPPFATLLKKIVSCGVLPLSICFGVVEQSKMEGISSGSRAGGGDSGGMSKEELRHYGRRYPRCTRFQSGSRLNHV